MAALSMLRFSKGSCLTKVVSNPLLNKGTAATCVLQKKSLMLTPVSNKRLYGPPEPATLGSHTTHWKTERVVAVALLPLIPAGLMFPNMAFDMALSTALVLHTHWGLSGVATDYIHGETIPKLLQPTILLLSIVAFAGLFFLNYNDIGFGKAVQTIWTKL